RRAGKQFLDAGAGAEKRLQAIVLIEEVLRRCSPRDRVVRAAGSPARPDVDVRLGQLPRQGIAPALARRGTVMGNCDSHPLILVSAGPRCTAQYWADGSVDRRDTVPGLPPARLAVVARLPAGVSHAPARSALPCR